MPSMDIVSEINEVELRHAMENTQREVATRFDFRGIEASIELNELVITLKSASDFQVRQLEEMLRNHCSKRGVSTAGIEVDDKPLHSGKTFSLNLTFKQGIDQPTAKMITKEIKDSGLKVQCSIQGDKVRVSGKKRDDLQACIAHLKKSKIELPLQFNNFRD